MPGIFLKRGANQESMAAALGVVLVAVLLQALTAGHARAEEADLVLSPADHAVDCPPEDYGSACGSVCHVLDPWGDDPVWSGRTEALLLWRSAPQGLPLFNSLSQGGVVQGPALNAADFATGMAAGPRFTVFRHTGDDGAIEFNFLRVQSFTGTRTLSPRDGGYQLSDLDQGIFCCPTVDPFTSISGGLSSSLQSFELNRRLPTDGRLQWLAGFRWVQWNEQIGIDGIYAFDGVSTQAYSTSTSNDLYGLQIGADSILYGLGGPFRIEGIGKSGVFYNRAVQGSAKAYSGDEFVPAYTLTNRSSVDRVAFVGEVGATAVYDLSDRITLRAGYAAFWLGGLALGSNQFEGQCLCPLDPIIASTNTGGSVFVHGLSLGLEGRW
jgi:hypothetical protein